MSKHENKGGALPVRTRPWTFQFWGADNREAISKATAALTKAGFSVGRRQRGAPSGILLGDYDIQKWRNLSQSDRDALHGQMHADHVPVIVAFPASPPEIDASIFAMHSALLSEDTAP